MSRLTARVSTLLPPCLVDGEQVAAEKRRGVRPFNEDDVAEKL